MCIKQNRRTACHAVNVLYFDRKKVFEVGPENSVYIHFCRMEGKEPTIELQPDTAAPPQAHVEIVREGKGGKKGRRKKSEDPVVNATAVQIDMTTPTSKIDYRVSSAQLQANTEANAGSAIRPNGRKSRVPPAPRGESRESVGKGVKFSSVDEISNTI